MFREEVTVVHDAVNVKYGGQIIISHAAVRRGHRGHGTGPKLIGAALDDIQALGRPVPVVGYFVERNPRYARLLANGPGGPETDSMGR
jgi:predicted GNAT family acetyltransferase